MKFVTGSVMVLAFLAAAAWFAHEGRALLAAWCVAGAFLGVVGTL